MGRLPKQGLDYFPLDVNFYDDDKVALIVSEFGIIGEAILVRLLCRIYKNGYYWRWSDDECLLFCKWAGGRFVPNQVREVISGCLRRSIFDDRVFKMFSVLTSIGIQRRYMLATNERKEIIINPDFWLIDLPKNGKNRINRSINGINPPINRINRSINPQSKDNIYSNESILSSTTPTNVVVVESDAVRDNIISNQVKTNAGARGEAPGEEQKPARSDKCMARKRPQPRKTLRKDDAGGMDDPEISTLPAADATWRDNFEIYLTELRMAYKTLRKDDAWISTQQRFYPNMNILLSLEKACVNFWATEAGWHHKKKQKSKTIDWRRTLTNAISQPQNKVYNDNRTHNNGNASSGVSEDFKRGIYETLLRGSRPEGV